MRPANGYVEALVVAALMLLLWAALTTALVHPPGVGLGVAFVVQLVLLHALLCAVATTLKQVGEAAQMRYLVDNHVLQPVLGQQLLTEIHLEGGAALHLTLPESQEAVAKARKELSDAGRLLGICSGMRLFCSGDRHAAAERRKAAKEWAHLLAELGSAHEKAARLSALLMTLLADRCRREEYLQQTVALQYLNEQRRRGQPPINAARLAREPRARIQRLTLKAHRSPHGQYSSREEWAADGEDEDEQVAGGAPHEDAAQPAAATADGMEEGREAATLHAALMAAHMEAAAAEAEAKRAEVAAALEQAAVRQAELEVKSSNCKVQKANVAARELEVALAAQAERRREERLQADEAKHTAKKTALLEVVDQAVVDQAVEGEAQAAAEWEKVAASDAKVVEEGVAEETERFKHEALAATAKRTEAAAAEAAAEEAVAEEAAVAAVAAAAAAVAAAEEAEEKAAIAAAAAAAAAVAAASEKPVAAAARGAVGGSEGRWIARRIDFHPSMVSRVHDYFSPEGGAQTVTPEVLFPQLQALLSVAPGAISAGFEISSLTRMTSQLARHAIQLVGALQEKVQGAHEEEEVQLLRLQGSVDENLKDERLSRALRQEISQWRSELTHPRYANLRKRLGEAAAPAADATWIRLETYLQHFASASVSVARTDGAWPSQVVCPLWSASAACDRPSHVYVASAPIRFGTPSFRFSESARFQLCTPSKCACIVTLRLPPSPARMHMQRLGFFLVPAKSASERAAWSHYELSQLRDAALCDRVDAEHHRFEATLRLPELKDGEFWLLPFVEAKPPDARGGEVAAVVAATGELPFELRVLASARGTTLREQSGARITIDCSPWAGRSAETKTARRLFESFVNSGGRETGGTRAILRAFSDLRHVTLTPPTADGVPFTSNDPEVDDGGHHHLDRPVVSSAPLPSWQDSLIWGHKGVLAHLHGLVKVKDAETQAFLAQTGSKGQGSRGQQAAAAAGERHLASLRILILGGGPIGLRCAIELALLGHAVLVIEGREDFTRLNVLKLWKWAVEDLKRLGVKAVDPKSLGAAHPWHMGTTRMQHALLKIALLLGVRFQFGTTVEHIGELRALFQASEVFRPTLADSVPTGSGAPPALLGTRRCDVLVDSTGARAEALFGSLGFCHVKEGGGSKRGSQVVAFVCNFEYDDRSPKERAFAQRSFARQFAEEQFARLTRKGIELEILVYYRSEGQFSPYKTHYVVAAASAASLLQYGVLKDASLLSSGQLCSRANTDYERLEKYAREAAKNFVPGLEDCR